jgi:hypothetical protein
MEKQESSKEKLYQEKFNKVTVFLAKFLFKENFDMLKKAGYVDSYINDPSLELKDAFEKQKLLFLLFKNKKLNLENLKQLVTDFTTIPLDFIMSYELVNDYSMIIVEYPKNFYQDYDNLIKGKYSKLSQEFKDGFPSVVDVFNSEKVRIGREYTMYYHVFNKTQWLKDIWLERLGFIELDDNLELWQKPDENDLFFNLKTII